MASRKQRLETFLGGIGEDASVETENGNHVLVVRFENEAGEVTETVRLPNKQDEVKSWLNGRYGKRPQPVADLIEAVEGRMDNAAPEAAPEAPKGEMEMSENKSNGNGSNGNEALEVILQAQFERRMVSVRYSSTYPDGTTIIRVRNLLPSHSYETKDGNVCCVAYDSYRNDIRTFRLDRMSDVALGEPVPAKALDDGYTVLYPATYRLRFAKPTVSNGGKEKYLAAGWSEQPLGAVLRPSA